MKKILVINHSNIYSSYGASTSLRDHFSVLSKDDNIYFVCFYRKSIVDFFKKNKKNKITNSSNNLKIESFWIPIRYKCFTHKSPGFIRSLLDEWIPNLISKILINKFLKSIEKIKPDLIHINSIILLPLLSYIVKGLRTKNIKIVLHVRELVDIQECLKFNEIIQNHINFIVCIDESVKYRFSKVVEDHNLHKLIVQSNPFCPPSTIDQRVTKYFDKNKNTYVIAGVVSEDKGVDFVCSAFQQACLNNSELLIIGNMNPYAKMLSKKYCDKNIKWVGEVSYLFESGAFLNIDCLVRGESEYCIGRTVYESLYSGGFVILQGNKKNISQNKELESFGNKVMLYEPRKLLSLIQAFQTIDDIIKSEKKISIGRKLMSNLDSYKNSFNQIYNI